MAFAAAFALPMLLALNDGGYDQVLRGEAGFGLWLLLATGLGLGLLPRSKPSPAALWALAALTALGVLSLVSRTWTESEERTMIEVSRVGQYLALVTVAYLTLNRYTWRAAAAGLMAALLTVPLLGLVARLAPDLIADEAVLAFGLDRLSYPLGYWNAMAAWGAMAVAGGIVWAAHGGALSRSLALAAVPAALLVVYLTYSRAGVFACAIAVLAAVALSRNRWTATACAIVAAAGGAAVILVARGQPAIAEATGGAGGGTVAVALVCAAVICGALAALLARAGADGLRVEPMIARVMVAITVLAVALVAAVPARGPLVDAWDEFRNEPTASSGDDPTDRLSGFGGNRYEVWETAADAFASDRSRGLGAGSFEFWWAREGDEEFLRDAHSLYFEQLAELGVPGLCALLAFLGLLGFAGLRARSQMEKARDAGAAAALLAVFAVFCAYAAVDWLWELFAVGVVGLGSAAIAAAGGFQRFSGTVLPRAALPALGVIAAGFAFAQIPTTVSAERVQRAEEALERGDRSDAIELAGDAISAAPWAASPYAQRALVYEAAGWLEKARSDLLEAASKEPSNWRHPLLLARVAARRGDSDEMLSRLAEVRKLSPRSAFIQPASEYRAELRLLLRRAG